MSIIKMNEVSFKYMVSSNQWILKDVNLEFEAGKMYGIVGQSGCGKTTMLSLLGGLDETTEGDILYNEENLMSMGLEKHRKENISFIFQQYNLIEYMTAEENVRLTCDKDAFPILEKLGLSKEEGKRNVLKLSGGQQQRVAIARAIAADTSVILADEPTGNLDEVTAIEIAEILQELAHESGKCIIMVTHSKEIAKYADHIIELSRGQVVK